MYLVLNIVRKYLSIFLDRILLYYKNNRRNVLISSVIVFTVFSFYLSVYKAPISFPSGKIIKVSEGATLSDVSRQFEEENIIRSSFWLRNIVILFGGEKSVLSGNYFFDEKENIVTIARRVMKGDFGLTPVRVIIPEGATAAQIARIFAKKSALFDAEEFLNITEGNEGYLFPDTYLFLPDVEANEVARVLQNTFFKKLVEVEDDIARFGKPLDEIVIMASLLEKEAVDTESRRIVSGILWERLRIDMPLQVDAVFGYINGKNSFELTFDDLDIDSPYNTYRYKGLPFGPIANPGLDSLSAAVNPIPSDYLYFLSDMRGDMHYSKTFEEHKRKKELYLN